MLYLAPCVSDLATTKRGNTVAEAGMGTAGRTDTVRERPAGKRRLE